MLSCSLAAPGIDSAPVLPCKASLAAHSAAAWASSPVSRQQQHEPCSLSASCANCACGTPAETVPGSTLQGVRSLQLHGHLLSAGSSMSALSFLDLRMRAWLAVDGPKPRPIQTQVDDYSVSQADEAITALQASPLGYVLVPVCL